VTSAAGTPIFGLLKRDSQIQITIGTQTWLMPSSGNLRIIFDGPVVEVFGEAGVFAALTESQGAQTISVTAGSCSIHEL